MEITKIAGKDVWAIRLPNGCRIDPRAMWKGEMSDWPNWATYSKTKRWARILANAWRDWLRAAEKAGMLTVSLEEYETEVKKRSA